MWYRGLFAAAGVAGALALSIGAAVAHDESRYPDWNGMWKRAPGVGVIWDETKPPALGQKPPLTPEYQAIWEASVADQEAGGQGSDTRVTCRSNGMPRMATIVRPFAFFIRDDMTIVVYDNNIPRWIYTDGRDFPKEGEPSYVGYSVGKWLDTDGDARFDTLEVETRQFKGPRVYDQSGIPLHYDNESIIKERLSLDKSDRNILLNEITTIDHALTQPWVVTKRYHRIAGPVEFHEDLCNEDNMHVYIGKEGYMLSGDGYLMPTKKNQAPPDLRYFKQTQK
jgi:hypothetical protein